MAKKANILRRSKKAENRVQRFLFGSDTSRCWKEQWDVGVQSEDGDWVFVGEVKNREVSSIAEAIRLLSAALDQVERVAPDGAVGFAVLLPKGSPISAALVAGRTMRQLIAFHTIEDFKSHVAWVMGTGNE